MGVGLSMEESPKDCVQRGALDCVVRRRPDIAARSSGAGLAGASTGVAAVAVAGYLATDAATEPTTMY